MGAEGAAVCLDAGANDLGGTLMNESITRAAGGVHGQELNAAQLQALAHRGNAGDLLAGGQHRAGEKSRYFTLKRNGYRSGDAAESKVSRPNAVAFREAVGAGRASRSSEGH